MALPLLPFQKQSCFNSQPQILPLDHLLLHESLPLQNLSLPVKWHVNDIWPHVALGLFSQRDCGFPSKPESCPRTGALVVW